MTEQTTEALIAEARRLVRHSSVSVPEHANMLGRLADALEAADQLAETRGETIRTYERENADWERRAHIAEQRAEQAEAELRDVWRTDIPSLKDHRDKLAAVVEKVRAWAGSHSGSVVSIIRSLLATAPADALRELKADAWDEGHSWGWSDAQDAHDVRQEMKRSEWRLSTSNPYRAREEQDRG